MYTRWAPAGYKWSYNPYKWPYKWVTGVITLFITGRGPPCICMIFLYFESTQIPKYLPSQIQVLLSRPYSPGSAYLLLSVASLQTCFSLARTVVVFFGWLFFIKGLVERRGNTKGVKSQIKKHL